MNEQPASSGRVLGRILLAMVLFVGVPILMFSIGLGVVIMMTFMTDAGVTHHDLAGAAMMATMGGLGLMGCPARSAR